MSPLHPTTFYPCGLSHLLGFFSSLCFHTCVICLMCLHSAHFLPKDTLSKFQPQYHLFCEAQPEIFQKFLPLLSGFPPCLSPLYWSLHLRALYLPRPISPRPEMSSPRSGVPHMASGHGQPGLESEEGVPLAWVQILPPLLPSVSP